MGPTIYKKKRSVNNGFRKDTWKTYAKKHQKFAWEILLVLLHRKLMMEGAEPNDINPTLWINDNDILIII